MDEELQSLTENDVWDVVPKPAGRKVVDGRWVFRVKGNAQGELERFKARYVAKGFSQVLGLDYDEIFAPVARFDSLRLLLAISACNNWRPRQLDIKTRQTYLKLSHRNLAFHLIFHAYSLPLLLIILVVVN